MAITPQTDLYLLKCPIEQDNRNQINFASATAQYNYFRSLPKITYDNFSYQRKDNVIRIPEHIDNIIKYNYVMYRNDNYSSKWFYAFITDMEYASDHMTFVTIKTDVYQTWQFDLTFKRSFVEREHVNDDTVGANTVPEGLEYGDYISNGFVRDESMTSLGYILQASEHYDSNQGQMATNFGGVYNAGTTFYFPETNAGVLSLLATIADYANAGKSEAINNVYMIPSVFVDDKPSGDGGWWDGMTSPVYYDFSVPKQTTIDGYTPVNKKLLCAPYNFLVVDNNNGSANTYNYEYFDSTNCVFEIVGVPTCGGSIKCAPKDYKGEVKFQQEGIMAGKFPVCGWVNDVYTNWLTQQSVNLSKGAIASVAGIALGAGLATTGAGAAAGGALIGTSIGGLAGSVGQQMVESVQHSVMPATASGNVNGGDVNTCFDMNKFYFIKMSIKEEFARKLDSYFSAFGYKVNSLKVPNITGRTNWNYVKTIGANIEGNIPQDDMDEIKTMFDAGVTIWHNPSTYLDYSQSNNIV